MLEIVIEDGGKSSVAALARKAGIPIATAHRQVATLVEEGYLVASPGRGHVAGKRLLKLSHVLDEQQIITNFARPLLNDLSRRLRSIAQMGTLENNMVTYRVKSGTGANSFFTREGMQLEAYCSGIGKTLLAHLPEQEQIDYLANGPFVPLTENTIVEPENLELEFRQIRERGYAIDNQEILTGLTCVAAPITRPDGTVCAAISISQMISARKQVDVDKVLQHLLQTVREIEQAAFS